MALALLGGPTDEALARRRLPRCRAKPKQRENLLIGSGEVSQLRARERLVTQIVVAVDVLVPQVRLAALGDEFQAQIY